VNTGLCSERGTKSALKEVVYGLGSWSLGTAIFGLLFFHERFEIS